MFRYKLVVLYVLKPVTSIRCSWQNATHKMSKTQMGKSQIILQNIGGKILGTQKVLEYVHNNIKVADLTKNMLVNVAY